MASDMQVRALTSEVAQARSAQQQQKCNGVPLIPANLEDIVSALVTFELRQLSACSPQERILTKRRLMLKWHPDKNHASGGCGDLATRVVQEMQSRPEWAS